MLKAAAAAAKAAHTEAKNKEVVAKAAHTAAVKTHDEARGFGSSRASREDRERELNSRSTGLELKEDQKTLADHHAVEVFEAGRRGVNEKEMAELTQKHAEEKKQFKKDKAHDTDLRKKFDAIRKSENAIKDHEGKAQELKDQLAKASKAKTELDEKHAAALHTLEHEGGNADALSDKRKEQKVEKDKAEKLEKAKLAEIGKHDNMKKGLHENHKSNISKHAVLAEKSRGVHERHIARKDRFSTDAFVDASGRHTHHLLMQHIKRTA